jgi:hypothetical protein
MPEEVKQFKELSMTPAAVKKRRSREKQEQARLAALPEDVRIDATKKEITERWQKNRDGLSAQKKQELDEHIATANRVENFMNEACTILRDGNAAEDIWFIKHAFLEVEKFARDFPPTDRASYLAVQHFGPSAIDFGTLNLASEPHFFKTFGIAVDHIYGPVYHDFLNLFGGFYKKYRRAGLEEDDRGTDEQGEFDASISWEEVNELMLKNKTLETLVSAQSEAQRIGDGAGLLH